MEGTAKTLQQRLQILQQAQTELSISKQSLEAIKNAEEGSNILVPTGGGTFVHAKLGKMDTLIVNVGADVSVDMTPEDAMENVTVIVMENAIAIVMPTVINLISSKKFFDYP